MSEDPTVEIRRVGRSDFEKLVAFLEWANRPEVTRYFHPFPLDGETACRIACTDHQDRYYVAVWNKQIIGLCMLRGWDEGYNIPSFGILTDCDHRIPRLSRRLTEFAVSEAKKLGCRSIRLSVYESNSKAMRLFTSIGFREVSRQPVVLAGEPDYKIIMMKELADE